MGFEKAISADGFFGKIQQALRDGLGSSLTGGGNLGTVTLDVRDSRVDRAEAGLSRSEEMNKNFGLRPGGGMAGGWDRPTDYPGQDPTGLGDSRWQAIRQGGAIHTMRNVGSFYQRWGSALSDQDRSEAGMWAAMTASPAGRKVEDSVSGIERGGKRMAELLADYESAGEGTPAAMRATEQMIKLRAAIEALAATAQDGAESIGGEHGKSMKAEIEKVSGLALSGKLPGGSVAGGTTATLSDFMRLANGDVTGAATSIFGSGLLKSLNAALQAETLTGAQAALGGGLAGAAGIGAAGLGALYGGFKFGWGVQESSAEAGVRDAGKALDDYRLSNSMGAGFDLRGLTYTDDRLMIDQGKFAYRKNINMPMARRMLSGMGIGAGGWKDGGEGLLSSADSIYRRALDYGVDDGALSGFVGASIRSGETGRSDRGVERLLHRIGGLIAEGNKQGVSSNEKLGVLVSIRQAEQARTGFITEAGAKIGENLSRITDASGMDWLKGSGGSRYNERLAANENPVFNAMGTLGFLGPDGKLNAEGMAAFIDAVPNDQERQQLLASTGHAYIAQALAAMGPNRQKQAVAFLKGRGKEMSMWALQPLLGQGDTPNLGVARYLNVLRHGGDPASMPDALGADKASAAAKKEAEDYKAITAMSMMTHEVLETTRSLAAMKEFIDANFSMEQNKKQVQQLVWDGADGSRGGRQTPPFWKPSGIPLPWDGKE